ncbi:hypothetical protein HNP71_002163 [Acidocella aromatica]|uniref:Uncharacterized protein n=1 Tax=Acidocella aromatica TaxID=1303579 RepID=A0A840VDW5_9PROT|nr:hypothetical protein [Acidocella aromatica]
MEVKELAAILSNEGFRPESYDLSGCGRNESYVLREDHAIWSVFYSERGNENDKRMFGREALACDDLLTRLRADPTTKQR